MREERKYTREERGEWTENLGERGDKKEQRERGS